MSPSHRRQRRAKPDHPPGSQTWHGGGLRVGFHDADTAVAAEDGALAPTASATDMARLSDFELAQVLAFEEAGLPSRLALCDLPAGNARQGTGPEEATISPSPPRQNPAAWSDHGEEIPWIECQCGEQVHFLELDAHADMHAQEDLSLDDTHAAGPDPTAAGLGRRSGHPPTHAGSSKSARDDKHSPLRKHPHQHQYQHPTTPPSGGKRRRAALRHMLLGPTPSPKKTPASKAVSHKPGKTQRLGRAELGPYAHEREMPPWLRHLLEEGAKVTTTNRIGADGSLVQVESVVNETRGLVPTLARLSRLDRTVVRAFYCSPDVRHVSKLPKEGGFCGYRNIQMLISFICDSHAAGAAHFSGRVPTVLQLQDQIERAWDLGINACGRVETGGIKNTRKYIGTPEAQALFMSLQIPCEATAYTTTDTINGLQTMLSAICAYFDDAQHHDGHEKVIITAKPPIYFQHQGHSMTVVGVESQLDGTANLIVFDPMFHPSPGLKKLAQPGKRSFGAPDPGKLLTAHRRGPRYLERYRDFELLKLKPSLST